MFYFLKNLYLTYFKSLQDYCAYLVIMGLLSCFSFLRIVSVKTGIKIVPPRFLSSPASYENKL